MEARDARSGALIGSGRAPHPPTTPPRSEQDPAVWAEALATARSAAGEAAGAPAALSVAAQQHGLVVLDAAGEVIRPAKLWNDTESAPDAAELLDRHPAGRAGWAAATGSVPVAAFTVTKLAWLRRREPAAFERMASVLLPHDWLTFRLTGVRVTDRGDASGTGYWSPGEGRYRPDLLDLVDPTVDWDGALPAVLGPTEPVATIGGTVVGPGTGDNMAAALALGLHPGDLVLSLGTSGTAYTVALTPSSDPTGTVAGFADATGRFLPLVCTLNATKVTDAFARLLGVDHAGFDHLALSAPPGAGGVVVVPYLDGERTPDRPDATGVVTGLRSDVEPGHLARAAVEGVVCGLLEGAGALGAAVNPAGRAFLVGGGAMSAAYRQVAADLLGRPVVVPAERELVALGAAVQAAATLEQADPAEVAGAWGLGRGTTVEPSGTDGGAVREAYRAACAGAN